MHLFQRIANVPHLAAIIYPQSLGLYRCFLCRWQHTITSAKRFSWAFNTYKQTWRFVAPHHFWARTTVMQELTRINYEYFVLNIVNLYNSPLRASRQKIITYSAPPYPKLSAHIFYQCARLITLIERIHNAEGCKQGAWKPKARLSVRRTCTNISIFKNAEKILWQQVGVEHTLGSSADTLISTMFFMMYPVSKGAWIVNACFVFLCFSVV